MRLPSWIQRKRLLSCENAALTLQLNAIAGLEVRRYESVLSEEDETSLKTHIYLTRAASTILTLHLEEASPRTSKRAKEVLSAFERELFPEILDDAGLSLVAGVRHLMKMVHDVRTLPKADTDAEMLQQLSPWIEAWVKLAPNGKSIFESIGKLRCFLLVGELIQDMNEIDMLIADVLCGRSK